MTHTPARQVLHLRAILVVCLVVSAVFIATLVGTGTIHAAPKTTRTASIPLTSCTGFYTFSNGGVVQNCLHDSSGNQMCLQAIGGSSTYPEMEPCNASPAQAWGYSGDLNYPGYERIQNAARGTCLGFRSGTTQEGAGLYSFTCNNNPDQEFYVQSSGFNWGILKNYNSGYCIGIPGGRMSDNVNPIQWACNGSPDQLWAFLDFH